MLKTVIQKPIFAVIFLSGLYVLTRLYNLNGLPVFADEAIYIRWAQLMVNQPGEFTFFPLYDGKTPLHMWTLTQFLPLFPLDPLYSARLMSVIFGSITAVAIALITRSIGGSRTAIITSIALYIALPFTLFHDRMGLIDPMLTTWLALSFYFLLLFRQKKHPAFALIAGFFWGLALLTKVPALFMAPLFVLVLLIKSKKLKGIIPVSGIKDIKPNSIIWLGLSGIIGIAMLYSLKVSELFPFLFARSRDFGAEHARSLIQLIDLSWVNVRRVTRWLSWYLNPLILVIPLVPLVFQIAKRKFTINKSRLLELIKKPEFFTPLFMITCALVFMLPLLVLGQILASRYFLPVVTWLIPAAAISLDWIQKHHSIKLFGIAISIIFIHSSIIGLPLLINPDSTPLPHEDRIQYFEEWSSGHGIIQAKEYIRSITQENEVLILTEGYFGTLPDGLLMYFDRDPLIRNIEIHGIGQPIRGISPDTVSTDEDRIVLLLVNSHRLLIAPLPEYLDLLETYPRPSTAPSLDLYRVKPNKI